MKEGKKRKGKKEKKNRNGICDISRRGDGKRRK